MFQPRKLQKSPVMLHMASGENDSSVFLASDVRGKGLGQQTIKSSQGSRENAISKKPALGDVNFVCKSLKDMRLKPNAVKPDSAHFLTENAESKTSRLKNNDDMEGLKAEIGRDVDMRNLSLSPVNKDHTINSVEPIIQQYFDIHGEYPDIETIPTSTDYNDLYDLDHELWYSPPRETFDRSFEQTSDEEVESPFPYIWSAGSSSPMSEASSTDLESRNVSFNSGFELEENWEPNVTSYVPNSHPFFG